MAKTRLTQPSLKISKQQPTNQFNSLIKVLKPKVFITNSSNFKTLVQELTGNGSQSSTPSSFSPPHTTHAVSSQPAHVIHIDDHDSPDPSLDNIGDFSVFSPTNNMFMQSDYNSNCSSEELGLQWSQDRLMDYDSPNPSLDPSLDNMLMLSDHYSNCSSEELGLNEVELRNLESWLLDFDSSACSHDVPVMPMTTYEYEYNLPPFIM